MFDTLMYAKRLEAAGMTRDEAEAQVQIIAEMVVDGVATKQDLAIQTALTQKEFLAVRADMNSEFAAVRAEMHLEFAAVRAEMAHMNGGFATIRSEMAQLENRLTLRMGGAMIASTTLTVALLSWILK